MLTINFFIVIIVVYGLERDKMNRKEKDELMLDISVIRGLISNARNDVSKAEDLCYDLLKKIEKG